MKGFRCDITITKANIGMNVKKVPEVRIYLYGITSVEYIYVYEYEYVLV